MGWTFHRNLKSKREVVCYLLDLWDFPQHALVGNHLWLVSSRSDGRDKAILLYLLEQSPCDGDWGYKDVSETSGPTATDCPKWLLDAVPDPRQGYSTAWRENCRAAAKAQAVARRAVGALTPGCRVQIGGTAYTLETHLGRKGWYVLDASGKRWRIKARDMATIVRNGGVLPAQQVAA